MSVHILVLIHGMWGNPGHLKEMDRMINLHASGSKGNADGFELKVILAETNRDESTYDGIDWGGERVAQEVMDEVEKLEKEGKKVERFSVTGYSLGGLVARYVVGILRQRGFFEHVCPMNFNTVATPHIGLLRYPSLVSSVFSLLGPKLLSRTGEQFYCVDHWSKSGRPLLEVMADPDRVFYQTLATFRNIRIYANAVNDTTVPYVTSAIETRDPFVEWESNGIEIELDDTYAPLIKSHYLPLYPPAPTPKPKVLSINWFRGFKPSRPFLPPAFQVRPPFNFLVYILLPLLIPLGITLALIRLSLAARSSRARIKLLESDETNSQRLIHILAKLEKQVEDTVVDYMDDPSASTNEDEVLQKRSEVKPPPQQPILSPLQLKIAASLNKLPNLKKELAYIQGVRNSHAVIVCRDVKRFEGHKVGEGILRHWSDQFIL